MIATTIPAGANLRAFAPRAVTGRDLISIQDFSADELACSLELASALKARPADFRGILSGKQIVLFFEKLGMGELWHGTRKRMLADRTFLLEDK